MAFLSKCLPAGKYLIFCRILAAIVIGIFVASVPYNTVFAKKIKPKVILYVPHDNRPVSNKQTVQVLEKAGYIVKVPPDNLLGNRRSFGNPEGIYQWILVNGKDADAAVISSDSLLYGSLVASRKHDFMKDRVLQRTDYFIEIHKKYPKLPLYVFSSIMRTPKNAAASGSEEPSYYREYGEEIFRYTALTDKQRLQPLAAAEQAELTKLKEIIPQEVLDDWFNRRFKNFTANKVLIGLVRNNILSYLVLGCDDNAPYSQTHAESVVLGKYSADLPKSKFCIVSGVDELGLLLSTRAANEMRNYHPAVAINYASGYGGATVPAYSDKPIDLSVRAEINLAGGVPTTLPDRAAMLLLVNTNVSGWTYEAGESLNSEEPRANTLSFADNIAKYIDEKIPVAVGDIAYANGADNALLQVLRQRDLLFKLNSYAGWNTATNSTGWSIAQGILSLNMTSDNKNRLLLTRYLDDWVYQANVRSLVVRQLNIFPGQGTKLTLGDKNMPAEINADRLTKAFLDRYLSFLGIKAIKVEFPWDRLFEADIDVSTNPNAYTKHYFGIQ